MNIFATSDDPYLSAIALDDRRLIKMVLETAQLLSGAVRMRAYSKDLPPTIYKLTHQNHPCAVWACETSENFWWLTQHGLCLTLEYTRRFKRIHKGEDVILDCHFFQWLVPYADRTPFANCSGLDDGADIHECYRECLRRKWIADADAGRAPRWTNAEPPAWKDADAPPLPNNLDVHAPTAYLGFVS